MISIILPVRNEPNLENFLNQIHYAMLNSPEPYEVLVVMGDRETLNPPISPRRNQSVWKTFGDSLERSILLGFSASKGEKIVVMDADGSHPPNLLPKISTLLDMHPFVVGSRFLGDSVFDQTLGRKMISKCFILLARLKGSRTVSYTHLTLPTNREV